MEALNVGVNESEDLVEGLRVFDPDATLDLTCVLASILIPTLTLRLIPSPLVMVATDKVDPDSLAATDPKQAEAIYKSILQGNCSSVLLRY